MFINFLKRLGNLFSQFLFSLLKVLINMGIYSFMQCKYCYFRAILMTFLTSAFQITTHEGFNLTILYAYKMGFIVVRAKYWFFFEYWVFFICVLLLLVILLCIVNKLFLNILQLLSLSLDLYSFLFFSLLIRK